MTTTTAVKVLDKAADVTKLIDSIESRGKKLATDIHRAAVSCLYHADKHGDVTLMQRLLVALPDFSRRNALIAWAVQFGKFAPSEDGKSVDYLKHGETDIASASAMPFWDFKPEKPFTVFDLGAELAKLVKRAEKAAADERNSLPAEEFRKLRELAATVKPAAKAVA
jgi:hypothetical protein